MGKASESFQASFIDKSYSSVAKSVAKSLSIVAKSQSSVAKSLVKDEIEDDYEESF